MIKLTFENLDAATAAKLIAVVSSAATTRVGQSAPARIAEPEAPVPASPPANTAGRPAPTPKVQELIDEMLGAGFDWTQIEPTGKDGKITQSDVKKHAESRQQAEQVAAQGGATLEDATNVLKAIVAKKGMNVGRELLAEFEAARLAELAPEKFGDFVKRAEEVLAS